MKRKIKSKKQLDRERKLKREEKKKEFERQYYVEKKAWMESGLDSWYEFDSLEIYSEQKLNEWDSQQLKIPTGKYQDTEKIISTFQQKFVEYTRKLCPQVIEEIREFVPFFDSLFGEQKDKYLDIFNTSNLEVFDLELLLDNSINHSIIKNNFLGFRPNKYQDWQYEYNWGEHRLLFHFLYLLFVQEKSVDKRNEILQDAVNLLQNDLLVERGSLNLPDDFDESILQNYVVNQNCKIIEAILLNDDQKHFREEAEQKIIKFLQGVSPSPETNFPDFIKLQFELLKWAGRHNLGKDWLLKYAYFFLSQFSNNPNIKLEEIEVLALNARSLEGYSFEFDFDGWIIGDEGKEDYEKRITECFEFELQRYFHIVSNHFDLAKMKKITKPLDYDRVKWLVRWTVQGWSKEQIREEIEQEFQNQGIEKYIDISTIDKAFRQFKEVDLPVRP